jgi:hypothetical protein
MIKNRSLFEHKSTVAVSRNLEVLPLGTVHRTQKMYAIFLGITVLGSTHPWRNHRGSCTLSILASMNFVRYSEQFRSTFEALSMLCCSLYLTLL